METGEIFSDVLAHSVEGLMFHDQLANYFAFLGLHGFQKEQEYRYMDESVEHRKINKYIIGHYNKLMPEKKLNNPSLIPTGWYNYTRQDVDTATRRNAVKEAFDKWIAWETETKELYGQSAKKLYDLGHVAGAIVLGKMTADVDDELSRAEQEKLELESAGYDPVYLFEVQDDIFNKYMRICP